MGYKLLKLLRRRIKLIKINISLFDFKEYINNFHVKSIIINSIIIAIFIILYTSFKNILINYSIIDLFIIQDSTLLSLSFSFLTFLCIAKYFTKYNSWLPSLNSIINACLVTTAYYFLIRSDHSFALETISLFNNHIYYLDLILLSCVFLFINTIVLKRTPKSLAKTKLLSDNNDVNNDELNRRFYAAKIVRLIESSSSETSFAIGINGKWGMGKTNLLNQIKSLLAFKDNKFIIVEFNPWIYTNYEVMVNEYFNLLSENLYKYNSSITNKLKDYSSRIFSSAREPYYKLIDLFVQESSNNTSISSRYSYINHTIKKSSKKIVVIIDDLDRLSGNEIFEVLKLIRSSASFANTFYVVAYDDEYVKNAICKIDGLINAEEYLMKIFQINLQLPQLNKNVILTKLVEYLEPFQNEDERRKVILAFSTLSQNQSISYEKYKTISSNNLLEEILVNIRDIKRFVNSFKFVYNILKDEIELIDLIIIELIKNKYFEIYTNIMNKNFMLNENDTIGSIGQLGRYQFNETKFENTYKGKYQDDVYFAVFQLLKILYSYENKGLRRFSITKNYYLYFSYQLFSKISIKEYHRAVNLSKEAMYTKLSEWAATNPIELKELLEHDNSFENHMDISKYLWVYLKLTTETFNLIPLSADLVVKSMTYYNNYYSNDKSQFYRMLNLMNDDSIDPLNRIYFASAIFGRGIENSIEINNQENILLDTMTMLVKKMSVLNGTNDFYGKLIKGFESANPIIYKNNIIQPNYKTGKVVRKVLNQNASLFLQFVNKLIMPTGPGNKFIIYRYTSIVYPESSELLGKISLMKNKTDLIELIYRILKEYQVHFPINPNSDVIFELGINDSNLIKSHISLS